jgi:hypothetical protein
MLEHKLVLALALAAPLGSNGFHVARHHPVARKAPTLPSTVTNKNVEQVMIDYER